MTPKRRAMGELEREVLAVLWEAGDWLTPRAVWDRLEERPSDRPLSASTVRTIVQRLWGKGVLHRRHEGKGFAYVPVRGRAEEAGDRMVALLDAAGDPDAALAHFLAGLDATRRRHLRDLLGRRRS